MQEIVAKNRKGRGEEKIGKGSYKKENRYWKI
jgi:hypothetical protein